MAFPLEPRHRLHSPRVAKVFLPLTLGITLLLFAVARIGRSSYQALGRAHQLFWRKRLALFLPAWAFLVFCAEQYLPNRTPVLAWAFRTYLWCAGWTWRSGNLLLYLLGRLLPTDTARDDWLWVVQESTRHLAGRETHIALLLPALLPLVLLWLIYYGAAFFRYLLFGLPGM